MKLTVAKKTILFILATTWLATLVYPAVIIKIGSIAPARSPWDKSLKELDREWQRITKGAVKLKIYPGGIAGNEGDMLRKIRVGTLGGGIFSNRGLTKIYQDIYVLNIPFLITSEAELDYIFKKMSATFEKGIEAKGFQMIIWSMAGWIHFFTKHPVVYPDDLKRHKISFATGEPDLEQAWKKMGFRIIPNDLADMMMALQSGMVDSFYLSPLIAGSGQYFPFAPNMCDLKVAPLLGGMVISQKVWQRIPDEYKEEMITRARVMADNLLEETNALEQETIATMKEHGLVVNHSPADALKKWKETADRGINVLVDKMFSRSMYDLMLKHLNDFKKQIEDK